MFTTPSHAWSSAFRIGSSVGPYVAEFEVRSGSHILVPSFIYTQNEQKALMHRFGFVVDTIDFATLQDLGGKRVSPKLLCAMGSRVVTGFRARPVNSNVRLNIDLSQQQ